MWSARRLSIITTTTFIAPAGARFLTRPRLARRPGVLVAAGNARPGGAGPADAGSGHAV